MEDKMEEKIEEKMEDIMEKITGKKDKKRRGSPNPAQKFWANKLGKIGGAFKAKARFLNPRRDLQLMLI